MADLGVLLFTCRSLVFIRTATGTHSGSEIVVRDSISFCDRKIRASCKVSRVYFYHEFESAVAKCRAFKYGSVMQSVARNKLYKPFASELYEFFAGVVMCKSTKPDDSDDPDKLERHLRRGGTPKVSDLLFIC